MLYRVVALMSLCLFVVSNAADDPMQGVQSAISEEDYADALALLEPLVEAGNATAQSQLGVLYAQGLGVEKNVDLARELFEKSYVQGDAFGAYNLAWLYATGTGVTKDCGKALEILRSPAERGNTVAQVNLASIYADGSLCTEPDLEKAVHWYTEAAKQEDPLAMHSLGAMHALGEGLEQDFDKALNWYTKAAEKGYAKSQLTLGFMYQYGQGVTPDTERAIHWYRLAADQGDEVAMQRLRELEDATDDGVINEAWLAAYLQAPADKLALEHNRIDTILMLTDFADGVQMPSITYHIGDLVIGPENREEVRAEFRSKLVSVHEAIERRGSASVAGDYTIKATRACRKIQSMWAQGVATKELGKPTILQNDHECQIVQLIDFNGSEPLETPAVIVEDTIIFADLMNTDFIFVGHARGSVIEIAPDADFILDAWPDWVNPPKRKDLEGCKVTLTRE
jgi:hypothetical protein